MSSNYREDADTYVPYTPFKRAETKRILPRAIGCLVRQATKEPPSEPAGPIAFFLRTEVFADGWTIDLRRDETGAVIGYDDHCLTLAELEAQPDHPAVHAARELLADALGVTDFHLMASVVERIII